MNLEYEYGQKGGPKKIKNVDSFSVEEVWKIDDDELFTIRVRYLSGKQEVSEPMRSLRSI